MQKTFYLNLVTSYRNTGDLLINKALVELLNSEGQVIISSKYLPDSFLKELTINTPELIVENNFFKRLFLDAIQKKSHIYVVGIPGHFFGKGLKLAISTIITGIFLHILKLLKVKIMKFGGCIGPFSKSVLIAEKFRSKAFSFYGLRDSISLSLLKDKKNIRFSPDLAFLSQDIINMKNERKRKQIVISFRDSTNDMYKESSYVDAIKPILSEVIDSYGADYELIFCYQVPSDRETALHLFNFFSAHKENKSTFLENKLNLEASIALYSSSALVLSNRLHILLPSLIANTPHLAIIDKKQHHKIGGIYDDMAISDLIIDLKVNNSELKNIKTKLDMIFSSNELKEKVNDIYIKALKDFKEKIH